MLSGCIKYFFLRRKEQCLCEVYAQKCLFIQVYKYRQSDIYGHTFKYILLSLIRLISPTLRKSILKIRNEVIISKWGLMKKLWHIIIYYTLHVLSTIMITLLSQQFLQVHESRWFWSHKYTTPWVSQILSCRKHVDKEILSTKRTFSSSREVVPPSWGWGQDTANTKLF